VRRLNKTMVFALLVGLLGFCQVSRPPRQTGRKAGRANAAVAAMKTSQRDAVRPATLPGGTGKHCGDRQAQSAVGVRGDEFDA
jgi:hypothetical protein